MLARLVLMSFMPLAFAPSLAAPPVEDEAHRLDRLQTKGLNERANARVPVPSGVSRMPSPYVAQDKAARPETLRETALRRRDSDAIAAWRLQVERCRKGERRAC